MTELTVTLCFWSTANRLSIYCLAIFVKIVPRAVSYKQLGSRMVKLLHWNFEAKHHSNHRVVVGRILRPQLAGDERNATPLALKMAGAVFHKIKFTLSWAILNTPLKYLSFEAVQRQSYFQAKRHGVLRGFGGPLVVEMSCHMRRTRRCLRQSSFYLFFVYNHKQYKKIAENLNSKIKTKRNEGLIRRRHLL